MPTLPLSPDELLTTTRTVRKRLDLDRAVPLELVRECLQVALQAPSGSNRQGWQWLVITDADLRRRIGDIYRGTTQQYLASRASAAKLFADDPDRAPVQHRVGDSVAWLGEHMGDVPVLVIPCIEPARNCRPATRPDSGDRCCQQRGVSRWRLAPAGSVRRGRRCIWAARPRSDRCWGCRRAFTRRR